MPKRCQTAPAFRFDGLRQKARCLSGRRRGGARWRAADDTAVLVGPDGFIGHYRKAHLWNLEKLWFTPGNLGFPVFDTPIGRIGMLVCWDIWFPEVPACWRSKAQISFAA